MDQMAVALGQQGELMALLCQPAELQPSVAIPPHVSFWGVDSGVYVFDPPAQEAVIPNNLHERVYYSLLSKTYNIDDRIYFRAAVSTVGIERAGNVCDEQDRVFLFTL